MIIHRNKQAVVHGPDLHTIYIDCMHADSTVCPMCGQKAECNVDLYCVSIGNQVRGFFYDHKDAERFAGTLQGRHETGLSKDPPEFYDFCELVFEPGQDYRTGDIRMLLREHIVELREIVQRWYAGV